MGKLIFSSFCQFPNYSSNDFEIVNCRIGQLKRLKEKRLKEKEWKYIIREKRLRRMEDSEKRFKDGR